jgi:hypothetical protein
MNADLRAQYEQILADVAASIAPQLGWTPGSIEAPG